mmetsp:Transcript_22076/g.33123  ORF Transcript_22076/g.33123 Transcript_22076/m.33123 type:complete len:84 (+) Transcript_22076:2770-3021(+)
MLGKLASDTKTLTSNNVAAFEEDVDVVCGYGASGVAPLPQKVRLRVKHVMLENMRLILKRLYVERRGYLCIAPSIKARLKWNK